MALSLCCNGVNLVDKDYRWRVLFRHSKYISDLWGSRSETREAGIVTDHTRAFAEIFLHKFTTDDSNECGRGMMRNGLLGSTLQTVHSELTFASIVLPVPGGP